MLDPVAATIAAARLGPVLEAGRRAPGMTLAVIDGPIDTSHSALAAANIEQTVPQNCTFAPAARAHATMIASILVGAGDRVLGLCPAAHIVSLPVADSAFDDGTIALPRLVARLCDAIAEASRRQAHVIHISLEFHPEFSTAFAPVAEALAAAAAKGTITVISAGNAYRLGSNAVLLGPGVLPVAMCDRAGRPAATASYGRGIGARGVSAPGEDVPGAVPDGHARGTGTSYAAAIVTGTVALLRSICPRRSPHEIIYALRGQRPGRVPHRSLFPPPVNGELALALLARR